MKKTTFWVILILIAFIVLALTANWFLAQRFFRLPGEKTACTMEAKLCPDGSYVGRELPDCSFASCPGEREGILVFLPKSNDKIKSPLKIQGEARGFWFFEAEFTAELFDESQAMLGQAILTAKSDWMTEDFVPFEGELFFSNPEGFFGMLKFLSSNPSGLPEHQRVFEVLVGF